jgi:putative ABC transport system permease protein
VSFVLAARAALGNQPAVALLTLSSVAASVALASGLELGARAASAELDRTQDALTGSARLEISAGDLGVPEAILAEVAALPGVRLAAPVIEVTAFVAGSERSEPLRILGVDLLLDTSVRSYARAKGDAVVPDPLQVLGDSSAVVVSEALASARGLAIGDSLRVRSGAVQRDLTLRGVLARGGVADAYAGQIAVMDVYALQAAFGRPGMLDRIDLVPEPGADLYALLGHVERVVAGRASVRIPESRRPGAQLALDALRSTVGVLALIGTVVAALVSFGALSISVERRSEELALLRAIGLEATRCRRLVRLEAALLCAAGTGLGIAAAVLFSAPFRQAFALLLYQLEGLTAGNAAPGAATIMVGLGVGLAVSLLGSVGPARRATERPPLEVLRGSTASPEAGASTRRVRASLGAASAAAAVVGGVWSQALPAPARAALALGGVLGLAALLVPAALWLGRRGLRFGCESLRPGLARLVGGGVVDPGRHAVTAAVAVTGVVTSLTALLIVLESLVCTLDEWQNAGLNGALIVIRRAAGTMQHDLIPRSTIEIIRETPGIRGVAEQYVTQALFRGEPVQLYGYGRETWAQLGEDHEVLDITPAELTRALAAGEVEVSDQVARRFDLARGDVITLTTSSGPRPFRIASRMRASPDGLGGIGLDIHRFDEIWGVPGAQLLVLWHDGSIAELIARIRERLPPDEPLFFVHGEALEQAARRTLARFDPILYALFGLTGVLGGFAVASMSFSSLLRRRREFALLHAAGAGPSDLFLLVLLEALLLVASGVILGVLAGLALAGPLTSILTGAFGWTLEFVIPAGRVTALCSAMLGVTMLLAVLPARLIARVPAERPALGE